VIIVGAAAVVAGVLSAVMTMAGNEHAEPLRTRQAPPIFSLPPRVDGLSPGASRRTQLANPDSTAPATVGDFVIGATVNLEVLDGTGRMRLRNFLAEIDPVSPASSESERAQFRFVVRRGLSTATCVSLEAENYPGFYLRQQTFVLGIGLRDGTFSDQDATFCPVPAPDGGCILRTPGYQDRYLVARDDGVHLDDISPARSTSFAVRTAL
jgi:hypothetical protein